MPAPSNTIIKPNARQRMGYWQTWKTLIRNIYDSRELIYQLYKRDFLMKYRKSILGMSWLIITPALGLISWVFMNSAGVLEPGEVGIPYPAYVLMSTTIWGLFMNFSRASVKTMNISKSFIKQVNFHHDALFIKQLLQEFSSFMILFLLTIIIFIAFGIYPSWWVLAAPVLLLPMMLMAGAFGLVLSIPAAAFQDIENGYQYFLQMLMFITPVIYSKDVDNPVVQKVIQWNPLTYLVGDVRDLMIYGELETWRNFGIASAIALVLFLVAWRLFYIAEEKVIEKMI